VKKKLLVVSLLLLLLAWQWREVAEVKSTRDERLAAPSTEKKKRPANSALLLPKQPDQLSEAEAALADQWEKFSQTFSAQGKEVYELGGELQGFIDRFSTVELMTLFPLLQSAEPAEVRNEVQLRMVQRLAERSPEEAVSLLQFIPKEERPEALNRLARVWSRTDGRAAVGWANSITNDREREAALLGICTAETTLTAQEIFNIGMAMQSAEAKALVTSSALRKWGLDAPEEALRWGVRNGAAGEQMAELLMNIAESKGAREAAASLPYLENKIDQGNSAIGLLQRWSVQEPTAALDWLERFPEGELRDRAVVQLNRQRERNELMRRMAGETGE
jgi:hypothetical protein